MQTVLRSGIAKLFVSAYSTQMRAASSGSRSSISGGERLPRWDDVPNGVRKSLIAAGKAGDAETCNRAVFDLYRMTEGERAALGGNEGDK